MRRKRKITILAACILYGLILSPPEAQATLIRIQIEAVVDGVNDPYDYLEGLVNVGDLITGTYTYDTDTPDSSSLANVGRYEHYSYPCGFSLTVGGLNFMTDPANTSFTIQIANNYPYSDTYGVASYSNLLLPNGAIVDTISWGLRDDSGSAVSNTELLTTAPVLSDWTDFNRLNIEGNGTRDKILIQAHVTSGIVIPEPGTIVLIGVGAIAIVRKVKK